MMLLRRRGGVALLGPAILTQLKQALTDDPRLKWQTGFIETINEEASLIAAEQIISVFRVMLR